MRQMICPPSLAEAARAAGMSPAVRAGDFIYFTGAVGVGPDGVMPDSAAIQTEVALGKVLNILASIGADVRAIVDVTSYHVDIADHFEAIQTAMTQTLGTPLPAWTAVEVKGLRRPGALVEFRCVAHHPVVVSDGVTP